MQHRLSPTVSALARLLVALLLAAVVIPTVALADGDEDAATEDVIFMTDGRELHGQILEEKSDVIIFEFVHGDIGVKTKLTLLKEDIAKVNRDVPLAAAPVEDDKPRRRTPATQLDGDEEESKRSYGSRRITAADVDVPSFYIVPMKGQMGTDINLEVYEEMIDDIREHDPDYIIIHMDCQDSEDRLMSRIAQQDRGLDGSTFLDMYREVVGVFRDELRDTPQILWIEDAVGISSVIAMSWPDMYMHPRARFGGIAGAARNFMVADPEVRAKFREGYMGWLRGFAEYGDNDIRLIDAMVLPDTYLSATWKGRDVVWTLDKNGEYVVDDSDKSTVNFSAKHAEDFCISDGTAESLDDLALLMGIREYRVCDGAGEGVFEAYREDWRRRFENCAEWFADYEKFRGWASGDDAVKYLGRAKQMLQKIIAAARAHKAIELRLMMDYGVRLADLELMVDQMNEQLRAMRQRGGRGGGGGRGAPGGRPGAR
jgi:hypothetical protein